MTSAKLFNTCALVVMLFSGACMTDEEALGEEYEEETGGGGKEDSDRQSPPCQPDQAVSLSACALLGTIAYAEGTGPNYHYTFAFRVFDSYDDHPRLRICSGRLCSTAAGRYQILEDTWDGIRGELPDFTPASQDQAGLQLVRGRGVSNIDSIDTYEEFKAAIYKLNREWASLPGSPYGQPTHTMSSLWTQFKRLRGI